MGAVREAWSRIAAALTAPGTAARYGAAPLAVAARAEHATTVVIGHPHEGRWRRLVREPLVDQLLHLLDGVDLHLVEPRREGR